MRRIRRSLRGPSCAPARPPRDWGSPAGRPAPSCRSSSATSRWPTRPGAGCTSRTSRRPADWTRSAGAQERGIRVTCDVTPHHLALTDAWVAGWRGFAWEEPGGVAADPFGAPLDAALAYDPACRVNPPLAPRAEALALLAGVADGSIDAIATDHAPHPRERKGVEFGAAAPGMIGLETALSLGLAAVEAGEPGAAAPAGGAEHAARRADRRDAHAAAGIGRRPGRLRSRRPLAGRGVGPRLGVVEHAAARDGAARRGPHDRRGRSNHLSRRARRHRLNAGCGATGGRMWDHAQPARMSIRTNEELDPNEGPGFGCFVWQAILFAGLLFLIPIGLFTFNWPVWVLVVLLLIDMVLLFFISMTSVFLLRVFFADRRRGRGRTLGAAGPTRVISTERAGSADPSPMSRPTRGRPSSAADGHLLQRAQGARRALQARHAPLLPQDRSSATRPSTGSASSAGSTSPRGRSGTTS